MKTTNTRHMWRPKFSELPEQCASCPFRFDNAAEFGVIVARLRKKQGIGRKPTASAVMQARMALFEDVRQRGDFMCHNSVYNQGMELKPQTDWRQCPGASKVYRDGGLTK